VTILESAILIAENFSEALVDAIPIPGILIVFILIVKLLDFVVKYEKKENL